MCYIISSSIMTGSLWYYTKVLNSSDRVLLTSNGFNLAKKVHTSRLAISLLDVVSGAKEHFSDYNQPHPRRCGLQFQAYRTLYSCKNLSQHFCNGFMIYLLVVFFNTPWFVFEMTIEQCMLQGKISITGFDQCGCVWFSSYKCNPFIVCFQFHKVHCKLHPLASLLIPN